MTTIDISTVANANDAIGDLDLMMRQQAEAIEQLEALDTAMRAAVGQLVSFENEGLGHSIATFDNPDQAFEQARALGDYIEEHSIQAFAGVYGFDVELEQARTLLKQERYDFVPAEMNTTWPIEAGEGAIAEHLNLPAFGETAI